MGRSIEKHMRAVCGVPNGLQVTDEGIWVVDQLTDRVALVENTEANEYGVTRILREIPSDSSTTSGVTFGEGALWLAANGPGERWRPARATDAVSGEIIKTDPRTGGTLGRFPLPGGGGTHGIEYDRYDPGTLWLTTLKNETLTQVRSADWTSLRVLPLPHSGGHGVVRVEDSIWVSFRGPRKISRLSLSDGSILDEIDIGPEHPEPHGLSIFGDDLLYCDATSGWIVRIAL